MPDGAVYRTSWRQPPGASEFASLPEWLAYCATPQGTKASISVYLTVDELDRLGSEIGDVFLRLSDASAPLLAYCYPDQEPQPEKLGPDDGRAAHQPPAQASFDADTLAELAAAPPHELELDQQVYRAVAAAIGSGKHVILTGPPGTAKTTLAELAGRLAGQAGLCSGYTLTTATADWTTYDTIGGLRPAKSGDVLEFRDGLFLETIRKGRWLVIDELNRSNFDRAFGQLFTVLSGQSVVLPYEDPVSGKRIVLSREGSAGQYDPADYEHIYIPESWRIVATMNVFDKSLLFEMSFALMRRFAFIEVPSPRREVFAELWSRQLAAIPSAQSELTDRVLNGLYGLTSIKDIGPAVFIDMAAFAKQYFRQGAPPSAKDLAFQLFFSYLLPQFEGISKLEGEKLYGKLLRLVGESYRDQLRSTLTEVLGITLSREQPPDEEDDADVDLEADLGQGGAEPPDDE
jgi:MoxR-like ATPase